MCLVFFPLQWPQWPLFITTEIMVNLKFKILITMVLLMIEMMADIRKRAPNNNKRLKLLDP